MSVKEEKKSKTNFSVNKQKNDLLVKVYNLEGKVEKTVSVSRDIFSILASDRLLAQYVRVFLANQRAGTASTKTRGEVKGSTRKIYSQKGTGRARHGDIKAPIFVGGGVVSGPKPRDFSLKINKKQKRKALFYSLTLKFKEGKVKALVNDFLTNIKKTRQFAEFLTKIGIRGEKIAVIMPAREKSYLEKAIRNIPRVYSVDAESLNAYMVLRANNLLFVEKTFKILEKVYLNAGK